VGVSDTHVDVKRELLADIVAHIIACAGRKAEQTPDSKGPHAITSDVDDLEHGVSVSASMQRL
jgi:hypothetical protein